MFSSADRQEIAYYISVTMPVLKVKRGDLELWRVIIAGKLYEISKSPENKEFIVFAKQGKIDKLGESENFDECLDMIADDIGGDGKSHAEGGR